jgi:hypothetical protein
MNIQLAASSCIWAYCSTLKIEAVHFSEMSVNFYGTARSHISEYKIVHSYSVRTSNPRIKFKAKCVNVIRVSKSALWIDTHYLCIQRRDNPEVPAGLIYCSYLNMKFNLFSQFNV